MNLTTLLHANLTKASGRKRDRYAADTRDARRAEDIADFESCLERLRRRSFLLLSAPRAMPFFIPAFYHTQKPIVPD